MNLFEGRRRLTMQPCKRCGGLLQSTTPRDVYDGNTYHLHCGWKVRRADDEKKAVRDIAPPLINLGVDYVPKTIVGNEDPT
jgi:hypothetical protein